MKTIMKTLGTIMLAMLVGTAFAQQPAIQYFRPADKTGLNVFETPKATDVEFDGLKVRIGGAFALQYQAIDHENAANDLVDLTNNFNLATADLDLDVQLADGVAMHLRTYLSSRHHTETYVKGGYIQFDKLDFIKEGFLGTFMEKASIKIGHMENNYGDAHFRRSDNGHAIFNPFVGNYIMDSFTTEVGGEVYYYPADGFMIMLGATNGRLNQSVTNDDSKAAFLAKVGYDKQMNDNFRFRLTGSLYTVSGTNRTYLYGGDRAGGRYYKVMDQDGGTASDFSGRINPDMRTDMTAIQFNPFIKAGGLEFFGIFETVSGRWDTADSGFSGNRNWTQIAGELIYRIGAEERTFVGIRYNTASGQLPGEETDKVTINRFNIGGGWFLTNNVLAKIEYMTQTYNDYPAGALFEDGKFNGIVFEAIVSF